MSGWGVQLRVGKYVDVEKKLAFAARYNVVIICNVDWVSLGRKDVRAVKNDHFIGILGKPLCFADGYCYEYSTKFT